MYVRTCEEGDWTAISYVRLRVVSVRKRAHRALGESLTFLANLQSSRASSSTRHGEPSSLVIACAHNAVSSGNSRRGKSSSFSCSSHPILDTNAFRSSSTDTRARQLGGPSGVKCTHRLRRRLQGTGSGLGLAQQSCQSQHDAQRYPAQSAGPLDAAPPRMLPTNWISSSAHGS